MGNKIQAVIIDDEKNSIITLTKLIEKYVPEVEIIATAQSVESGIDTIDSKQPELVFLDINMPDGDGFEVIENTNYNDYDVVFTTAYDEYAIKAFEFSAVHYLLKPIRGKELKEAVKRYHELQKDLDIKTKANVLNENIHSKLEKLILPTSNGLIIINLDDVIRCESSNNYTTFFLVNKDQIVVSKSINNYEQILQDSHFARVHNKHLINFKYIKKYVKGRGGYLIMENDTQVDVSEGKKKDFLNKLNDFARG